MIGHRRRQIFDDLLVHLGCVVTSSQLRGIYSVWCIRVSTVFRLFEFRIEILTLKLVLTRFTDYSTRFIRKFVLTVFVLTKFHSILVYSGTSLMRTKIYRNSGPYNGFSIDFTSFNTNSG